MRHQKRIKKIGSSTAHRKSMLRNLAMNIIIHEKVKTTETKAKAVVPFVDRLINIGKKEGKLHVIRELDRVINHENCARKIMEQLVDKYKDRNSGYTRMTKVGHRAGDAAPMVLIELV